MPATVLQIAFSHWMSANRLKLNPKVTNLSNYLREANRDAVGQILIFQFLTKLLITYTIIYFSLVPTLS